MRRGSSWKKRALPVVLGAGVGLAVVVGVALALLRRPTPASPPVASAAQDAPASQSLWKRYRGIALSQARTRTVVLSLFDPVPGRWERQEIQLDIPTSAALRLRAVAGRWLGAWSGRQAWEPRVRLLAAFILDDETAVLDFSANLLDQLDGTDEALYFLRGLSQTLRENFPTLRRIQLLVDGDLIPSLADHLEVREPLSVDFFAEPSRWEWKSPS